MLVDVTGFAGTLEIAAIFTAVTGLVLLPLSGFTSLPKSASAAAQPALVTTEEVPKPKLTKSGFTSLNQESVGEEEIDYSTGEASN